MLKNVTRVKKSGYIFRLLTWTAKSHCEQFIPLENNLSCIFPLAIARFCFFLPACLVTQSCLTLCDPMDCSLPGSSVYRGSPGKNTGVGCNPLLQGIFPTQESNSGLPHCRQILYHLNHLGIPLRHRETQLCITTEAREGGQWLKS